MDQTRKGEKVMWKFYHNITQTADAVATEVSSEGAVFLVVALITGLIMLTPSFLERRGK